MHVEYFLAPGKGGSSSERKRRPSAGPSRKRRFFYWWVRKITKVMYTLRCLMDVCLFIVTLLQIRLYCISVTTVFTLNVIT